MTHQKMSSQQGTILSSFISLYLLLLAMFALLSSMATFDVTKANNVVDNVRESFKNIQLAPNISLGASTDPTANPMQKEQQFEKEVEVIFAEIIPIERIRATEETGELEIELDVGDLFESKIIAVRESRMGMVQSMAKLLRSDNETDYDYHMEFIISDIDIASDGEITTQTINMQRAGEFARQMIALGVSPEHISVGTATRTDNKLVISFMPQLNHRNQQPAFDDQET